MKAIVVRARAGLDNLEVRNLPDPGQPGPGQIRVALHATSLNFHDLMVANGTIPTEDGRVLMSDGAGVVEAIGEGVTEFKVGDHVVSCFFTDWADGKLARLLNQSSRLGALLDPLVDRLYVVSTLVAFAIRGIIPWWVAAVLIGRDVILALTLPIYRRRGLPPPAVLYLGKAATFALMFALPLILAAQGDWGFAPIARAWGYALLVWGTGLYVWTGILYLLAARNIARDVPRTDRAR